MIKVNLLPKEYQEKGKGLDWIILGYAVFFLISLCVLSIYFVNLQGYKKNLDTKEKWSRQLSDIKAKVASVDALDAHKVMLIAKMLTVTQLFQGRILYPQTMQAFFETLPKDIWISNLQFMEGADRSIKIVAESSSLSPDAIADWLQTLETKTDKFGEVILSAIDVKASADPKIPTTYAFSMAFTFRGS